MECVCGCALKNVISSASESFVSRSSRISSGSWRRAREKSARIEGRVALKRVRGRG